MRVLFPIIISFFLITGVFADIVEDVEKAEQIFYKKRDIRVLMDVLPVYQEYVNQFPRLYEANWKLARILCEISSFYPEYQNIKHHKRYGKTALPYAKIAVELNPEGIEGHNYYAYSLAEYGIGISIIKAVFMGLAGEFKRHVEKTVEIDHAWKSATPLWSMGRYYAKVPWPLKDRDKAMEYYKKALAIAPNFIKGHVFLAELYIDMGKKDEARKLLKETLVIPVHFDIENDADFWINGAQRILEHGCKKNLEEINHIR